MKNLTQLRTAIRTDLRDSGTLWTGAEIDRSVERAVADYSRFQPQEKSYEFTVDYTVTDESFTSAAAADPDSIVDGASIASVKDGDTLTITLRTLAQPRPVKLTITDANASITDFAVIVKGTGVNDEAIEETFYFPGGLVQTGKKLFKTVQEVEVDSITGNATGDTLDLGYDTHNGVWVALAYKPIKPKSETVTTTDGATTYTRNTDYIMDYANGRIALKSGGSMSAATEYYIDYTKSQIEVDLSNLVGFVGVKEVIFADSAIPQREIHYALWGKTLRLLGAGIDGQEALSDNDHIAVKYYAVHSAPKTWTPGSYPELIENTIIQAAEAYALFIKALQYEHQAVIDQASARTEAALANAEVDKATAEVALGNTETDKAAAQIELADAAIDKVAAQVALADAEADKATAEVALADTEIDKVAAQVVLADAEADKATAQIALADTEIDKVGAQIALADAALDSIDYTNAGTYLTAAGTALTAAAYNAALGGTTLEAVVMTKVETALDAANTVLDAVLTTSIDKATTGAEAYLDTGDNSIPTVNVSERVPEKYREYAQARAEIAARRIELAIGYAQEAAQRINEMTAYVSESNGYSQAATAYVAEAAQRINMAMAELQEQQQLVNEANGYLETARAYIESGRAYLETAIAYMESGKTYMATAASYRESANAYLATASAFNETARVYLATAEAYANSGRAYIETATAYINSAQVFVGTSAGYMNTANGYMGTADKYSTAVDSDLKQAEVFKAEAVERRNEVWVIWQSPDQLQAQHTTSLALQPAKY